MLAPWVKRVLPKDLFTPQVQEVVVEDMEFLLVSPPEQPTPSDNVSRYLSTTSSLASDDVDIAEDCMGGVMEGSFSFTRSDGARP